MVLASVLTRTACENMSQSALQMQQSGQHLKTIVPVDIAFVGKTSRLSPQMIQILRQETKTLHTYPDLRIKVIGYSDNRNSPKMSQLISLRRAMLIADYFRSHGISSDRISALGIGSNNPVANNATAEGRAKNRRIELVLN
jgi:outer membrane protein OmpA-like peptidoglycan-associated protein